MDCKEEMIRPYIFDRELNNISLNKWKELFDDRDYCVIAQNNLGRYLISTVWVGISHLKLPFETGVFFHDEMHLEQVIEEIKHPNEEEALKYHLLKLKEYSQKEYLEKTNEEL